ncbi:MAG: hypothetical protein ABSG67_15330 [Thermoguttaceae bacterium]|jgi:hypothetical protein
MSGISSISSTSDLLYYLQLQQAQANGGNGVSDIAGGDQTNSEAASTTVPSTGSQSLDSLENTIQQDVLKAIQDAEQSGNTSDLKTVIHDAVDQALKDAGIDPNSQSAAANGTEGHKGHHGHGHHHAQGAGSTGVSTDPTNSSSQDTSGTDSTTNDLITLLQNLDNNSQQNTGNQNTGSQQSMVGFLIDIKQ